MELVLKNKKNILPSESANPVIKKHTDAIEIILNTNKSEYKIDIPKITIEKKQINSPGK